MLNVLGAEAFTANAVKYSQTWVLFLSTCNENATTAHECLPKCWCSNKPVKIFYELTLPLCSTVLAQKIHPLRMIEKNLISACHPFHAVSSYNPSPPMTAHEVLACVSQRLPDKKNTTQKCIIFLAPVCSSSMLRENDSHCAILIASTN